MTAASQGAGLEEAKRAGGRAARRNTDAAIISSIASTAASGGC
ncbi:hypothetical protein [Streptomyces sp. NPDC004296]